MSVWKNLFMAVKGHVNNTAEAVEDGQLIHILDQQIREAKSALGVARDERAKMVAKRNIKQKVVDEISEEIGRLKAGAKQAKEADDLELAREAIERVLKLQDQVRADKNLRDQYKISADQMQATLKQTEVKIENLQRQVEGAKANEALIAAQVAASTTSKASNSKLSGAVDSLKRLELRQAEQAAMLEAANEVADDASGDQLEAKLAKLSGPSSRNIDDMLSDL